MLQYHIATHNQELPLGPAPERADFLAELERVGNWPKLPRLLGVANGAGRGAGNGVDPGVLALQWSTTILGQIVANVTLNTQSDTKSSGEAQTVAQLFQLGKFKYARETKDIPDLDGAPGGTLNTIELAAKALDGAECHVPSICFVPTGSAVSIRDITDHASAYADINKIAPKESDLDAFKCCTRVDTPHTAIVPELATWILEQLK